MDDINTHVEITDKLMQELVDSGNFKQALKHADKRMKKTPTDAKLLVRGTKPVNCTPCTLTVLRRTSGRFHAQAYTSSPESSSSA